MPGFIHSYWNKQNLINQRPQALDLLISLATRSRGWEGPHLRGPTTFLETKVQGGIPEKNQTTVTKSILLAEWRIPYKWRNHTATFIVTIMIPNQRALTVAKVLGEKWFHVYEIPAHTEGRAFDNDILKALCKMYGVNQSLTCPYNPQHNALCKHFNHTMFCLLRTLSKEQKANWPVHLPALVFAYNATPHSTTGFQPYQLSLVIELWLCVTVG